MPQAIDWSHLKPTDLPAPPQEAIGIVHACSKPTINSKRLADLITHNAVLTAELLRIVNSAFFGFRAKATSAAHAVTLLGQRALRNLALCVAMRDALRADAIPGLDMADYWEQALRRAVAARCLARAVRLDAEDGFTAGLLQDFGLLVMLFLRPAAAGDWPRLAQADPDQRYALEQTLFGTTHDQVGSVLAAAWELPAELRRVMERHHSPLLATSPAASTEDALCRVARCADWMAAVFTAVDKRPVIRQCRGRLADDFGLSAEQADELLQQVVDGMAEAGAALGLRVGTQLTLEAVLREANLQLVEDNLSYQELTWRLEQALAERDRYAGELNRELQLAREVQRSLMPRDGDVCAGFCGMNTAARELSGDFYDYFSTPAGAVAFCIADVSGKGMNAALLMAKVSSLFRCLGKTVADPAALLGQLNREILETSIRGMFVTMIAGIYDPRSRSVRLANAGHVPALLQIPGAAPLQEIRADGPPLGIVDDAVFATRELPLASGALYLYTDGLLEARTATGVELGSASLKALILAHARCPAAQRARRLLEAVREAEVRDDLTVLIIDGAECGSGR